MAELAEVWAESLPIVRNAVTGVGVWTALNHCKPLAVENGFVVLGLPTQMAELTGHLRMAQTRKVIEQEVGKRFGEQLELRVIEGTSLDDWEKAKRRDTEAKRLQEAALSRARAEVSSRTNWDQVYEQLSRRYASTPNKTLPQSRARFYKEAIEILADARKSVANHDDLSERSFARSIERVAQYAEVPSTIVAIDVLDIIGEIG